MNATAVGTTYESVTEQPGQKASRLQLEMMAARYRWAREFAHGKDVLEAACGSGTGLGALAQVARSVEASDVDRANLDAARRTYAGEANIAVRYADAMALPYPDARFDTVLLFEAIYYLPRVNQFLAEARRVLRPGGRLLIASVNREWRGFNPSPFSVRYYSAAELRGLLEAAGFRVSLRGGFPEIDSLASALTGLLRGFAVALRLVPRTMAGKAFLKRLFYGRLQPIPARLDPETYAETALAPLKETTDLSRVRVLYAEAAK